MNNPSKNETAIAQFANELAAEFGQGWTVDADASFMHGVFVNGPDVRLYLRDPNYHGQDSLGRVEVTGSVPTEVPTGRRTAAAQGLDWGKISISPTRPIHQLRADIERRLLDTARKSFAAVLAREASTAADRAARHAVRDQLAALLHDPRLAREGDDDGRTEITAYAPGNSDLYTEWRLSPDGSSLNVKLDGLSPSQARQIAVLLFTYSKGK